MLDSVLAREALTREGEALALRLIGEYAGSRVVIYADVDRIKDLADSYLPEGEATEETARAALKRAVDEVVR